MNKDNILFAIVGLLAGVIIGFMIANSLNLRGAAGPAPTGSSQNQGLPPDHPPIEPGAAQPGPDQATVQAADTLAREQPDSFEAQIKAAELNYQLHRYDEAIQFLLRANTLRPDDYTAVTLLGNVNFDAGRYLEAEKWYTAALQKRPDDVNVRTDLGLTFLFRDPADLDRAIAEFLGSLERNPRHLQTLQNLTVAYSRKGDKVRAEATLAELEKVSPDNPAISSLRADLAKLSPSVKSVLQHGPAPVQK
jgi:tetratricopeptide (TPR) repeat protein